MALLAAITLLITGTPLDYAWQLNSSAYSRLKPMGPWIGVAFLLLSTLLIAASVGWFRRRHWGWVLATAIIAVQAVGDALNLFSGEFVRGFVGVVIAGALLLYLLAHRF
jgi:hypothetical protein